MCKLRRCRVACQETVGASATGLGAAALTLVSSRYGVSSSPVVSKTSWNLNSGAAVASALVWYRIMRGGRGANISAYTELNPDPGVVLLLVSALRLLSTSGRSRDHAGIETNKYLHAPVGLTTAAARPPASLAKRVTACDRMERGGDESNGHDDRSPFDQRGEGIQGCPVAHRRVGGRGVCHSIADASSFWANCVGPAVSSRDCWSETGTLRRKGPRWWKNA